MLSSERRYDERGGSALAPLAAVCLLIALVVSASPGVVRPALGADAEPAAGNAGAVEFHFFWSETCSHCRRARPFVEALPARHPWLNVHSLEVSLDRENLERYVVMAGELGHEARSVPAFLFCGALYTGFDQAATTGQFLEDLLIACHGRRLGGSAAGEIAPTGTTVHLPLLGEIDPSRYSLPVLTLVLAGLDSFNPCAFFVLLFLLSLLVHARSRTRILFIGGVFVLFSGLMYFVFMAAWLNLFLIVGQMRLVTGIAGAVAVTLAALNIKEYLWFGQGPSLSIPEQAKPGLFRRMRNLTSAEHLLPMVVATVTLAIAANTYELLCTAGFPMVYTRALTLGELGPGQHYLYLALYNIIYVVPLAAVVLVFAYTLGSRKLGEREGRVLKLASGLMMLGLGLVLLIAPALLDNVLFAIGMLGGAVGLTALVELVVRWRERRAARSTQSR
jgi:hypothetical protein